MMLCLALAGSAFTAPALAQDPIANDAPAEGATDAPKPAAEADKATTAAEPAKPADAAPAPEPSPPLDAPVDAKGTAGKEEGFFGVELLPGTAYPADRVRGLEGGSLWMTFPGTQWPYMPKRPGDPKVRLGFSGSAWVDTSYRSVKAGLAPNDPNLKQWTQQSRFVLRATPTYSTANDWFVQGQAEIVANGEEANPRPANVVDTDDLYVKAGKWKKFDVQAGRFQGWELYHFGMALDQNTYERIGARSQQMPVQIYGLTQFWDRPAGAGNFAIHAYPTDYLRFELLGQLGASGSNNSLGARPMGIFDLGWVKLKAGLEYGKTSSQKDTDPSKSTFKGWGTALQFVLDPYVEFGGNVAQGVIDVTNTSGVYDPAGSTTTWSYGGFANGRIMKDLLLGVGINFTRWEDLKKNIDTGKTDNKKHTQMFGALQYRLWERFYIKGVVAYSEAGFNPLADTLPNVFANKMISTRLRLMLLF
ncbi:MAG TPA: hypothetical protein VEQ59_06715 [Polyangiaceae bacterium]|nr:hypothetical protein [Polyangiaceae bacterium]